MILTPIKELLDSMKYTIIRNDRKESLQVLIDYIIDKKRSGAPIRLLFVCTHNSRRSHLAQIWAKVASAYFDIEMESYSGGVEITALNERVVNELKSSGFEIETAASDNPRYQITYDTKAEPIICFSKLYDDDENPAEGFAAVMTCSDADENCPFIPGTEARIPVRYEDPKAFDDTPHEADKYHERSMQIANEMMYVFSKVKR